jgi:hypothetical protein
MYVSYVYIIHTYVSGREIEGDIDFFF